jgi:hypothetical protein
MSAPFAWFDVTTKNAGEVREFYASLFGWTMQAAPQPYAGWMMERDQPWGGVMASDTATAGRWLPYVVVEDLDAAAQRAVALGASIVQDRTEGPAGAAVTLADPGGALLALFTPSAG